MMWPFRKTAKVTVPEPYPVLVTVTIKNAAGDVRAVRSAQFWVQPPFVPPR